MGFATSGQARYSMLDFWGVMNSITVTTTAGDKALNDVTPPSISGVTILHAYAMCRFGACYNSNAGGDNYNVGGTTYIQIDDHLGTGYTNAVALEGNVIMANASARQSLGLNVIGDTDIKARVNLGSASSFKWASADAQANNLHIWLMPGLRILLEA